MTLSRWRRLWNFQRWKNATIPMLINAGTGEVIPFSSNTAPTEGKWVLRRPLTLPGSSQPLFLEVPLIATPWGKVQGVQGTVTNKGASSRSTLF